MIITKLQVAPVELDVSSQSSSSCRASRAKWNLSLCDDDDDTARKRTVDDSMTYWFPWKHPMARLWRIEFGVFGQTPQKMGSSARPFGPRLSSVANAQVPTVSPFDIRYPPRGLGRAALDSYHAECTNVEKNCSTL